MTEKSPYRFSKWQHLSTFVVNFWIGLCWNTDVGAAVTAHLGSSENLEKWVKVGIVVSNTDRPLGQRLGLMTY